MSANRPAPQRSGSRSSKVIFPALLVRYRLAGSVAVVLTCAGARPTWVRSGRRGRRRRSAREHLFTRSCDFKPVTFTTTPGSSETRYTTESITLNTVFAGNVTASKVPADRFPRPEAFAS
jgi:hypothetical protein